MSDQDKGAVRFQPGGTGQSDSGGTGTPGADGQPQPFTQEQIDALEKLLAPKFEAQRQQFQRINDKQETRITKNFNDAIQKLTAAGVEITDDVKSRVHQRVTDEVLNQVIADSGANQGGEAGGAGQGDSAQLDPVSQMVVEIFQELGVTVEEGDPEFAVIDRKTQSPLKFVESAQLAAQQKKARLAGATVVEGRPASRPAPRTPTNVGATGAGANLAAQYRAELKLVENDRDKRLRLLGKYRALGYDPTNPEGS